MANPNLRLLLIPILFLVLAPSLRAQDADAKLAEEKERAFQERFRLLREDFEKLEKELEEPMRAFLEAQPLVINASDDEGVRLQKLRYNNAIRELEFVYQTHPFRELEKDLLWKSAQQVVDAGLEAIQDSQERIQVITNYLAFARIMEESEKLRFEGGDTDAKSMLRSSYERLGAEILLLKEKRKLEGSPKTKVVLTPSHCTASHAVPRRGHCHSMVCRRFRLRRRF